MQINIQSGAALAPRDDVLLHISVRPQENVIVRNHLKNQVWGAEERYGGNPIQAHQSFEFAITAEHSQYRIVLNGQHFCTFSHRLPLNLARYVSISGTCSIQYITIDQTGYVVVPPSTPHYPVHQVPVPPAMPALPPPYPGNLDYPLYINP